MAGSEVAAGRYAQAAFAIAQAEGTQDRWQEALQALRALMAEPVVAEYMRTTRVAAAAKTAMLEEALGGQEPKALNLVKLLLRKRRIGVADQVAEAFEALLNAERGVALVSVTTATPLSAAGRESIIRAVRAGSAAREVRLEEHVERAILGGAIVRIGDHLVDGSVRTRLRGLRRSIAGGMV